MGGAESQREVASRRQDDRFRSRKNLACPGTSSVWPRRSGDWICESRVKPAAATPEFLPKATPKPLAYRTEKEPMWWRLKSRWPRPSGLFADLNPKVTWWLNRYAAGPTVCHRVYSKREAETDARRARKCRMGMNVLDAACRLAGQS